MKPHGGQARASNARFLRIPSHTSADSGQLAHTDLHGTCAPPLVAPLRVRTKHHAVSSWTRVTHAVGDLRIYYSAGGVP